MSHVQGKAMRLFELKEAYQQKRLTPRELVGHIRETIKAHQHNPIWIYCLNDKELEPYLARLETMNSESLPLYGIPFAIKDNIDLAGIPTTAACPDFSYIPQTSAYVVECLIAAGAIPIGKTNLDQFATELVGTRSAYGVCQNSIDATYISGGSSSGSALSVALDMVTFSLGTDTAGSGRVPAAFNKLVGFKPTKGLVSTSGLIPACRSLDCITLFCKKTSEAKVLFDLMASYDKHDVYARKFLQIDKSFSTPFCIGVPYEEQLEFFGDKEAEELFHKVVVRFQRLGITVKRIDFSTFKNAATLLYDGPWVAERYVATKELFEASLSSFLEVTRSIIAQGKTKSAGDYFEAEYALKSYQRKAEEIFENVDFMLTPTTGTIFTIKEVEENPIELNTKLGYYTNFMNLLDLCACALPAGVRSNKLPFGVTVFSTAFNDKILLEVAAYYERNFNE